MSVNKFAVTMLKRDMKQSGFFVLSMVFSVAVIFNIFNIIYNEKLIEFQQNYLSIMNTIALSIIGVAIFFTFFASSFFLINKTKELGIAALSGLSTFELAKILLCQSFLLIVISIIAGLGLGVLSSPIFNHAIYKAANISGNGFDISKNGLYITIFFIFLLGLYLVLFNWGYVYRQELIDLVTARKQVVLADSRMVKLPKLFYILIFILPIFMPFITIRTAEDAIGVFGFMAFVTYGTQGVIRYFIPYKILEVKRKYFFNDKLKLISLSNLYYSIRTSIPLVVILAIGSTLLISLIGAYSNVPAVGLICIFTYVLITILIAISLLYKVLIESYNRRNSFVQLRLIGYNREQIIQIILQEIIMFGALIIGAPLLHIILLLITFLKAGVLTIGLAVFIISVFLGVYITSTGIAYLGYKKIIVKHLYGGK